MKSKPPKPLTHEQRLKLINQSWPTFNIIGGRQWAGSGIAHEDRQHIRPADYDSWLEQFEREDV